MLKSQLAIFYLVRISRNDYRIKPMALDHRYYEEQSIIAGETGEGFSPGLLNRAGLEHEPFYGFGNTACWVKL